KTLLLHQLNEAKTRKEQAETLVDRGDTETGRATLRHAIRWMIEFVHRTGSLTGGREIGAGTQEVLSQDGRSILRDMQNLLRAAQALQCRATRGSEGRAAGRG